MSEENSWSEWSKHVLKELERLNNNFEIYRQKQEEIKNELTKVKLSLNEINNIKGWKGEIDEIMSPTQLKALQEDVSNLKIFKSQATTVIVVVQVIVGIIASVVGLLS